MNLRRRILASVLAAACDPALAEEARADGETVELSPLQVTAGREPEPAFAVPQGVTVVDLAEIRRNSPRTVADLLRGQTGAYVQSSGPGQGVVIVRGLKGSEVLHLVDGMRLNNAFFRNSPSQYVALVDPHDIDRVELLRGPASTLYGSDALGGVVHFLTPEQRFTDGGWATRAGALAQYGSADLSRTGRGWVAVGQQDLSLSLGATYTDAGGIRTGGDGPRIDESLTGYIARGHDAKLLWSPAAGQELMLSLQSFEYPELPRYHEISVQPNNDPAGVPQRTEALFKPNARGFWHLRWRGTGSGFVDAYEAHLARQVIDDDRSVIPRRPNQTPQRRELEDNRSTLDGLTLQLQSRFGASDFRYGLEAYRDAIDSAKSCQDIAPDTTCANATSTTPVFPDGSSQATVGAYLSSQTFVTEAWLVDAGIRWNEVRTDLKATPLSDAARIQDGDLSANLGSALEFAPGWKWTANAAHGFRAPNIFDLGTLGPRTSSGVTTINVPNPGLESERLDSLDTGIKWQGAAWRGEVVAFRTEYRDRIEPREPTGNTVPQDSFGCPTAGGCEEVRSENISRSVYWGFEAGAGYRPVRALEVYGALNLTRGNEERAGAPRTPANRVPPVNGRVGTRWEPSNWVLEGFVLFSDDQHRLDADDAGDIRIAPGGTPGWATVNVRAAWEPVRDLRLQLDGGNLFDAAYREHGSGIDGFGRSVTLTARAAFP